MKKLLFIDRDGTIIIEPPVKFQVNTLKAFKQRHSAKSDEMLKRLQQVAIDEGNLFEELMETVRAATSASSG